MTLRVQSASGAASRASQTGALSPVSVAGAALWALAVAALFFYLLVYLAHTANLAAYPYDLDQGEAYDLNSGWLIAQGRPIYTSSAQFPYYSSNYPPVYSLLLAPIVGATGPTLASGRLLSAAATLLAAAVIALVVGRRSGRADLLRGLGAPLGARPSWPPRGSYDRGGQDGRAPSDRGGVVLPAGA